jgi:hypothetical protein
MITIVNLTPHPVTIVRPGREAVIYPACAPAELPRAVEEQVIGGLDLIHDDTQGAYACTVSCMETGLVDSVGYTGVTGLPELTDGEIAFGCTKFYIVSIVTVLGALAAGRPTCDLLVPMGQVRDANGRIIGATGLAQADVLLSPLATTLRKRWRPSAITHEAAERHYQRGIADGRAAEHSHLTDERV